MNTINVNSIKSTLYLISKKFLCGRNLICCCSAIENFFRIHPLLVIDALLALVGPCIHSSEPIKIINISMRLEINYDIVKNWSANISLLTQAIIYFFVGNLWHRKERCKKGYNTSPWRTTKAKIANILFQKKSTKAIGIFKGNNFWITQHKYIYTCFIY